MTTTEPKTITTVRADQLRPADEIKLVGNCIVQSVIVDGDSDRCMVSVVSPLIRRQTSVWLWKYSRIEVLSDVAGRGHLVTPVHSSVQSESMEAPADAAV